MVSQRVICKRWVNSFYSHGQTHAQWNMTYFACWHIHSHDLTAVHTGHVASLKIQPARGMIWTCQVSMILKNILGTHFLMLSIISIYLSCQESSGIIWFSCLNFPHCTVVDSVWFRRSLGWKSSCLARHDAAKTATLRLFWCRVPLHYKLFLACTGHVWSYS